MYLILAVVAFLVGAYSFCVIIHCVTREPLTITHRKQLERSQMVHTVILIAAALVCGLAIENLL
jgi:hypothetical protein